MAFANLKVILLNGIWKPLVFNINAQGFIPLALPRQKQSARSAEHTSELQSLMRISYAVFCLKKKKQQTKSQTDDDLTRTTHPPTRLRLHRLKTSTTT